MNEFELQDYGSARNYADAIYKNATDIMGIFDDINNTMNQLYGENWESSGAEGAQARYTEIRNCYDGFYQKVVAMKNHINSVVAADEAADTRAAQNVENI